MAPEIDQVIADQKTNFPADYLFGAILEFDLAHTGDEPIASLEAEASGIRVLSATKHGEVIRVSVFVPEGKLPILIGKIEAFLDPDKDTTSKTGERKAKNALLVTHIDRIKLATLGTLWTDFLPLPDESDDELRWWEIWLWVERSPQSTFERFIDHAGSLGIETSPYRFDFPQRIVTTIRARRSQIASSVQILNALSEVRFHRSLATFVSDLPNWEQQEWLEDLLARLEPADLQSPAICILDTGVNHLHPLLGPVFPGEKVATVTACGESRDQVGHGTAMAGIAAYGDLAVALADDQPVSLNHHLESVRVLRHSGDNDGKNHASIVSSACEVAEGFDSELIRHYCMAVTLPMNAPEGVPTAHSAAIDKLAAGEPLGQPRLFLISGGNVPQGDWASFPQANLDTAIHDPGQSWNALTVGAFTDRTLYNPNEYPGHTLVAQSGDISPSNSTSYCWREGSIYGKWPYKPDIVLEGGNALRTPAGDIDCPISLAMVTANHRHHHSIFTYFDGTSAATAEAARMAATISAAYPDLWPETIRALMVHSADWSPAMWNQFVSVDPHNGGRKEQVRDLLRFCGWGIPSMARAMTSLENRLTLIYQSDLQPFDQFVVHDENTGKDKKDIKSNDMHLHQIPWPREALEALGGETVKLRVTLSYFIEPNPSHRGIHRRYRYESCGLRFTLNNPVEAEDPDRFRYRINKYAQDEEDGEPLEVHDEGWLLGPQSRNLGSLHMDIWKGPAEVLAKRYMLAIYPTMGWWRSVHKLRRWNQRQRYALVLSITSDREDVQLYTPVANTIRSIVEIEDEA